MNVFLLCTVRKPELLPAATFVFDSIRVGFPTAQIVAFLNQAHPIHPTARKALLQSAGMVGAVTMDMTTNHWDWIRSLVMSQNDPFVLCDTDVVLWDKVEDWTFEEPLAGRLMPMFKEEFTKSIYMPRVHTSLLFVNPERVREKIDAYYNTIPDSWFTPKPDLFATQFVPTPQGNLFYDTCALLYAAIGGQAFTEEQMDCYDHLHGACSVDIIGPHITDGKMQERQKAIFANPESARGKWRQDDRYFNGRTNGDHAVEAEHDETIADFVTK